MITVQKSYDIMISQILRAPMTKRQTKSTRNPDSYISTHYNATKHGVLSRVPVLPWEDTDEFAKLQETLMQEYKPQGTSEEYLVLEMANCIFRKQRVYQAENALITQKMNSASSYSLKREADLLVSEGFMADLGNRQGRFNINSAYTNFVNNKHKGIKKEFKKALSAVGPKAVEHFDNTMDMMTHNKKIFNQIANTSHTAHTTELISQIKRYGAAATAAASGVAFMPLVGVAAMYGGLKAGAHLWTDRRLLAAMNRVAIAKRPASQNAALDAFINAVGRYDKQKGKDNE